MNDFGNIKFMLGTQDTLLDIRNQKPKSPFSDEIICFFDSLSKNIRNNKDSRSFSDVMTFGFWCRKKGILQYKEQYGDRLKATLGRGTTLHFAPSNVPVMFAYSMAAALLSGNNVIVRLPSKRSAQTDLIINGLKKTLNEFPEMKHRMVICCYEHDKAITDKMSQLCDLRIVWGGDETINEIRKSPLPPTALELSFRSRSSMAMIDAAIFRKIEETGDIVREFYNDTFLYDQNACSSPRIICWVGNQEDIRKAKERFWYEVSVFTRNRYHLEPALAVKKRETSFCLAANVPDVKIIADDNLIVRVELPHLMQEAWEYSVPGGFFIEINVEKVEEALPIFTAKCQTLSCLGFSHEKIAGLLVENQVSGIDRIVDFGHALDFSLTWDGIDLIENMIRKIKYYK